MKNRIVLCFLFLAVAGIPSCRPREDAASGKTSVVASIFVLYDFARAIGGPDADVSLFIPPGVEPHAYEPTARDILSARSARVFLYTGGLMEPWADRIIATVRRPGLFVVNAAEGIPLRGESGEGHATDEHRPAVDPHFWLDPVRDLSVVDNIRDALVLADPAHADGYAERAGRLQDELAALDRDIRATLAGRTQSVIVFGGHNVFGYFGERYGLSFISPYPGFSPEAEPQARVLVELVTKMKRLGLAVIYFEENVDPKVARVLAGSTGARLVLLHGAHNVSRDELDAGVTFLSIMRDNLEKLKSDPGLFPGQLDKK